MKTNALLREALEPAGKQGETEETQLRFGATRGMEEGESDGPTLKIFRRKSTIPFMRFQAFGD